MPPFSKARKPSTSSFGQSVRLAKVRFLILLYSTIDDMTYGQKDKISVLLRPTIVLSLSITGEKSVTASGYCELEMLEPMSREKVWLKRLQLDPITQTVVTYTGIVQTTQGAVSVPMLDDNGTTALLNSFYATTMETMWKQLDAQEIDGFKHDVQVLKAKTQYRGGS